MMYADPAELTSLTKCSLKTAELTLQLASNSVDDYVRHRLNVADESQILAPTGAAVLWVVPAGWPLSKVTVLQGDDELIEGSDFRVRPDGSLWRFGGRWHSEVEVSYTTGFEPGSIPLLTAKRITLETAARAAANPQLLDAMGVDGASPSFLVREGQEVLSQLQLTVMHRISLDQWRWRRRLA